MVMIQGDQAPVHTQAMWLLRFDHFVEEIGFVTCGELQAAAEVFRYAEGGDPLGEEFVAGVQYGDLALERGVDGRNELNNWWKQIHNVVNNGGEPPDRYKHDGELVLLNWDRTEGPTWDLVRGFMKEFKPHTGLDTGNKTSAVMSSTNLGLKQWELRE